MPPCLTMSLFNITASPLKLIPNTVEMNLVCIKGKRKAQQTLKIKVNRESFPARI